MELTAYGRTVKLNPGDSGDWIAGRIMARNDFYERDLLEDIKKRVAGGVAVDVGAHVGNHTVWLAGVCDLKVVALEPDSASLSLLLINVEANNFHGNVKVIDKAAGAVAGKGWIKHPYPSNTGRNCLKLDPAGVVEVITIDSLELEDVSVIKIDVEGGELEVLKGAERTIERWRPLLYVEADGDVRHKAVASWLEKRGYAQFGRFARTPTWGFQARVGRPRSPVRVQVSAAI